METINDRLEMLINQHFNGNKAAFANAVGIPPTSVSNYFSEKRRSKPSVDILAKLVNILNVDARWLLTGEESKEQGSATAGNGSVAVAGNVTAHHITANSSCENAVLQERVKSLEALLAEKERLIKVYEKMAEGKQ